MENPSLSSMIVPFKNRHVVREILHFVQLPAPASDRGCTSAGSGKITHWLPISSSPHISMNWGNIFGGNMMKYDEKLFCSPLMIYLDGADGAEEEPEGLEKALDVLAWVSGSIRCHHWNYASRLSSRACYEVWQDPVMAPHCRHSKACRRLDCRAK